MGSHGFRATLCAVPSWQVADGKEPFEEMAPSYRGQILELFPIGGRLRPPVSVYALGQISRSRVNLYKVRQSRTKLPMGRTGRPRSSGSRLDLDEPLASEFADFLTAHHTASGKAVLHKAIRAFIDNDLAKNQGVREEYEALRRSRRDRNGKTIHLIRPEKTC